jgi:electron transport complex protein RnfG
MNTVVKMLLTLTLVGVVSGGLLSQVDNWAAPKIKANRQRETERAIYLVQPLAKDYKKIDTDFELYKVFDESGNTLGYSLPFEGNGFQGNIRLMVGVKPDMETLVGLEVLEQVETPGLGTKVTEPFFTKQFQGLVANPQVDWVKGAPPTKPNEIQAITGATISSKALVAIVNAGLKKLRETKSKEAL